jgi:hypothetical protein
MPNEEKIFISVREKEKIIIISHDWIHWFPVSYRDIVSKESWLWQFCCKNNLINEWDVKNFVWQRYELNWFEPQYPLIHKWNVAEYRVIESALCDEDKLESFILDNIKI